MIYRLTSTGVLKIPDEGKPEWISRNGAGWDEFLSWQAEGNTPLPDTQAAAMQAHDDEMRAMTADLEIDFPSWAEVETAIDGAWPAGSQRFIVKRMAKAIYRMAKRKRT